MTDRTVTVNRSVRREVGPESATKLLLTLEEAAGLLSIGRTRVYELVASGQLATVRIGTSRRVPFVVLEQFVEQLLVDADVRTRPVDTKGRPI